MSETKHTPGPWMIDSSEGIPVIFSQTGSAAFPDTEEIATVRVVPDYDVADERELAEKHAAQEEAKANAYLISAAPDLHSVVSRFQQKLATYVSVYPGDKELRELLVDCETALAKAQGK
jgi:hypothetical protein